MKTLYVNNTDLTREKRFSFLTESVVSGGSTIAIQSILGFESLDTSSGQIVCIGDIGNERTELLRTSNTSGQSPSANYKWVYLRDTLSFDHPQDTKVFIVDYNRVEAQWASTTTGTKSTLRAYPLLVMPDLPETVYTDTTQTSGFYFTRFNENVGNTNSDWSDPIPFSGYDDNMVFSIKKRALDELGEKIDGELITHEFLNQCLWQARREYHQEPGKRPFRRKYNIAIGNAMTGSFRIELPTDVETPYSAENVYGVRIGATQNMTYYDKKEWDFDYLGKPHSNLTAAYVRGARDLYVASARDFAESGVVTVENSNVTYSAKSISGGTLRISADGASDCSSGSDVWQNISYGLPSKFTVFATPQGSAYIYFNRPIETAYINQNIFADYYTTLPGYDSDADTLDEPQYDMFVNYLKFRIKERKSRGNIPVIRTRTGQAVIADADYQLWIIQKQSSIAAEMLMTQIRISPQVDHLPIPE